VRIQSVHIDHRPLRVYTIYELINNINLQKQILHYENDLRLSQSQQELYRKVETNPYLDWMDVTAVLQEAIVMDFCGDTLSPLELEQGLNVIRSATHPDMKDISLYRKYNRARMGELKNGDFIINVPLVTIHGQKTDLLSFVQKQPNTKPLFVISGSIS
jgi:hypothetical protein